jgi:hypothetical protein
MIVVRVELWSAISGKTTELARMMIDNDGTHENHRRGNYNGRTYKGRSQDILHKAMLNMGPVSHVGRVENHARLQEHIWVLVTKMLISMGYNANKDAKATAGRPIPGFDVKNERKSS